MTTIDTVTADTPTPKGPTPAALCDAITQAARRASVMPVTNTATGAEMLLRVVVKYASNDDSDHDGWGDHYDGDPEHRLLMLVQNASGETIDAFYGWGGTDRCTPCTLAPPRWWDRD